MSEERAFKESPCRACGKGVIRPLAVEGRTMAYKGVSLPVPGDIAIPTCEACGEERLDGRLLDRLEDVMESAWLALPAEVRNPSIIHWLGRAALAMAIRQERIRRNRNERE